MAADKMVTSFGGFTQPAAIRKIRRVYVPARPGCPYEGDWIIGCAGDVAFIQAAMRALEECVPMPDIRAHGSESQIFALAVPDRRTGGAHHITSEGEFLPIGRRRWALGAGMEVAMGAMEAGADARAAVVIAQRLSNHAGMGVQVWRVR